MSRLLMLCEQCGNGDRRPERSAQVAEKHGRIALVLGVP